MSRLAAWVRESGVAVNFLAEVSFGKRLLSWSFALTPFSWSLSARRFAAGGGGVLRLGCLNFGLWLSPK